MGVANSFHVGLADVSADFNRTVSAKRLLDIVGSLLLIVALAPALLVIAAVLAADGGGPVLFRQTRTGFRGKSFEILKFRSMRCSRAGGGFVQAVSGDSRVTPFGRILRMSSLDELPQLFNVLRGEMSLVGPRPHVPEMDFALATVIPHYWLRYSVTPGMSGLAQINGYRGPTTPRLARRRICLDRLYIRKWSIWLDLGILLMTPFRMLGPNAV